MKTLPVENTSPAIAIAAALQRRITPDQIAATLADALSATCISKSGSVEPDTRSRLNAAQLVLAYQVGRPVERQEVVSVNVEADTDRDLSDRLRHSPALRAALTNALRKAEGEAVDV